jgi:hypothetical protein
MHGMDNAALEELRALRARAYGPHADIDQDPAAVRRLRELEAQSNGSTTRSSVDALAPATSTLLPQPASAAQPELETAPESAPDPAPEPEPEAPVSVTVPAEADRAHDEPAVPDSTPRRAGSIRRISRRIGLLWGLSVIAAAALAASITFAVTSMAPVSVSSGAPQIATLEAAPLAEVPSGWFGAGPSSRVFEFYGLTLFETSHGYVTSGTDCFMVVPTEQLPAEDADPNNWSMSGPMYSGCRVGDFPATVAVPVDSGMPEAIRNRFPPGSALQFVLDGDRIGVFLDSD